MSFVALICVSPSYFNGFDWLSMFYCLLSVKKYSESDSNSIVSLYLYRYSCGLNSAVGLHSELF